MCSARAGRSVHAPSCWRLRHTVSDLLVLFVWTGCRCVCRCSGRLHLLLHLKDRPRPPQGLLRLHLPHTLKVCGLCAPRRRGPPTVCHTRVGADAGLRGTQRCNGDACPLDCWSRARHGQCGGGRPRWHAQNESWIVVQHLVVSVCDQCFIFVVSLASCVGVVQLRFVACLINSMSTACAGLFAVHTCIGQPGHASRPFWSGPVHCCGCGGHSGLEAVL